jgi:arylsulfatase A-like enzyme
MTIARQDLSAEANDRRDLQASVFDVMPTVLAALGVPLSRALSGKPLAPFNSKAALRYVDTYGKPNVVAATRAGQPLDQEMIDRLRSLGYVR